MGSTVNCTVAGSIWIQPTAGGPAKRMRAGVAMDPAGEFVVVVDTHKGPHAPDEGSYRRWRRAGGADPRQFASGAGIDRID